MPSVTTRHLALLLFVCGVVFFLNLGTPRLWDRDEPRNAGCAAEMLARGDWVVPVFNGQLREAKPALFYWLIMAAYAVVGVNEWGARLPSAVLATGTVFVTYAMGRRLFSPAAGLWGALALATSLLFDVAARAATPDSTLIFFCTLGLAAFVLGVFPKQSSDTFDASVGTDAPQGQLIARLSWRVVFPLYAALGLAVLAKGPVGVVLPVGVIGLFLSMVHLSARARSYVEADSRRGWQRITTHAMRVCADAPACFFGACRQMRLLAGLAIAAAVALPWYLWVGSRTNGAWLEGFLWNDNVRRVLEPLEDHGGSVLFYPAAILFGFLPWSVFAIPVLLETFARLRRSGPVARGVLFCVCWIGVYVGLFSLARTKLPSYVTPCYPALALLCGAYVERWLAGRLASAAWWPRVSLGTLACLSGALLVALPVAARHYLPGDEWLGGVVLIPLLGATAALVALWRDKVRWSAAMLAATAVLLQGVFFGGVLVRVDRQNQSQAIVAELARRSREPRLGAYGRLESSWVYYAGRPIDEFHLGGNRVPVRPLHAPPVGETAAQSHLREFAMQPEAYLITTRENWASLQQLIPDDMRVLAEVPYFLQQDTLLLVGREAMPSAEATGKVAGRSPERSR